MYLFDMYPRLTVSNLLCILKSTFWNHDNYNNHCLSALSIAGVGQKKKRRENKTAYVSAIKNNCW